MSERPKDLKRHPALSAGGRLPHVVIVYDAARPDYISLFVDGQEILLQEDARITVEFGPDLLPVINEMFLANEVEVITRAEMDSRLH